MAKSSKKPKQEPLTFHYIKSNNMVDLPVNGAYGGISTDTGRLFMAVFSERSPIPQEVDYVTEEGKPILREIDKRGKTGVIRTVNAVLHFDINTAVSLHEWLGQKLDTFKEAHPEIFKDGEE